MKIPAALVVVPILGAALLVPLLTAAGPEPAAGQIGMTDEEYSTESVTIHVGQPLTLVNNSEFLHVLLPGEVARSMDQAGMPAMDNMYDTHVSEAGDVYTTQVWDTPGTYHLTCALHPEMNLEVIVVP